MQSTHSQVPTQIFSPLANLAQYHLTRSMPDLTPRSSATALELGELLLMSNKTVNDQVSSDQLTPPITPPNDEADKIQRNSLYLTFNAPNFDEYHRGLFITYDGQQTTVDSRGSGTLFHASYIPIIVDPKDPTGELRPKGSPRPPSHWILETRTVKDVTRSASLVLMIRLGSLVSTTNANENDKSIADQFAHVQHILARIPLGRPNREKVLGPINEGEGHRMMEDYDCIIWCKDALAALHREGVLDLGVEHVDTVMKNCRAASGPPDARMMVGKDHGGFKVVELRDLKPWSSWDRV